MVSKLNTIKTPYQNLTRRVKKDQKRPDMSFNMVTNTRYTMFQMFTYINVSNVCKDWCKWVNILRHYQLRNTKYCCIISHSIWQVKIPQIYMVKTLSNWSININNKYMSDLIGERYHFHKGGGSKATSFLKP